jgi:hypothetical protein
MQARRIVLVLALLSLAACFFMVAPAMSGEHPWDADKPNDTKDVAGTGATWLPGGATTDTTIVGGVNGDGCPDYATSTGFWTAVYDVVGVLIWVFVKLG